MNKFAVSLLATLIPIKKIRRKLRERFVPGKLHIAPGNTVSLPVQSSRDIIICGSNNRVIVKETKAPLRLDISIVGNNNEIVIEKNFRIEQHCRIVIGTTPCPCNNSKIHIGKNTHVNDVYFLTMEDDSIIECGDGCMFSWGVYIWATDSHAIYKTQEPPPHIVDICNRGKFVKIGKHVWIGMDVKVGKNTEIADGCIVGWGSVVTHSFIEKNCIIAGVPAKVVKRNRSWNYLSANMF